jgi:hypothetical protein
MEKAASAVRATPSLTLMTMSEVVPMSALVGVPLTAPEAESKVAQEGRLETWKDRSSPSASEALGWNV